MLFQFTHPGKGATLSTSILGTCLGSFNSRTLGRVRRNVNLGRPATNKSFNSRTLGRVRLRPLAMSCTENLVSIHAPWEGCDEDRAVGEMQGYLFQFTHPGKGATVPYPRHWWPWRGFNSRTLGRVRQVSLKSEDMPMMFQFTHPGKGATLPRQRRKISVLGFNSRTLGRVRLNLNRRHLLNPIRFNSRTLGRVRL